MVIVDLEGENLIVFLSKLSNICWVCLVEICVGRGLLFRLRFMVMDLCMSRGCVSLVFV